MKKPDMFPCYPLTDPTIVRAKILETMRAVIVASPPPNAGWQRLLDVEDKSDLLVLYFVFRTSSGNAPSPVNIAGQELSLRFSYDIFSCLIEAYLATYENDNARQRMFDDLGRYAAAQPKNIIQDIEAALSTDEMAMEARAKGK